jgi:UDP-N-acetylmuramoyl-L-alanyl-D-glutamate--2,6-diaminopimelate ligase
VFTNLTRDHLDFHGDMDAYAAAKASLFERDDIRLRVFNVEMPSVRSWRAAQFAGALPSRRRPLCRQAGRFVRAHSVHTSTGTRLTDPASAGMSRRR